jgi:hypothetical protein
MRLHRGLPLLLGLAGPTLPAAAQDIGTRAPPLSGVSGDGRALSDAQIAGKVAMIWYEDRDSKALNLQLKAEIKRFAETELRHPERLVVIAIGDTSGVFWPFTGVAKKKLLEASRETGLVVYGDWNGDVRRRFRFKEGDSNLMFVDDQGIVRFRLSGRVEPDHFEAIEKVLRRLVDGD